MLVLYGKSHILYMMGMSYVVTCFMLCCIFITYRLTKYPLTPLHKNAVIGGLKRFDQ